MAEIAAKKCDGCEEIINEAKSPWIKIAEMIIHTQKKDLSFKKLDFCESACIEKFIRYQMGKPQLF